MAVVCAVAIVASIAGILNAFTQDDLSILVGSTRLHGFGALRDILRLPYWPPPAAPDLYRPVASILLAVQYALGGGAPFVFRIMSYALYALASVGVYRLALRLMPASIALLVAVLFAAHPVHVEAVALAVTQNELIVGAVAAFTTVLYLDRRRSESGALSARDWAMLGVGYTIAGFSKEQGLLIPAFLILAEIFLAPSRALGERVRQLWRGFAVLITIAAVMIAVRTLVLSGVVGPTMIAEALRGQTMGGRLLTMLQIVPQWTRLLVWPVHLRAEYSPREFVASTSFGGEEATGLAIVILVLMSIWLARKRAPARLVRARVVLRRALPREQRRNPDGNSARRAGALSAECRTRARTRRRRSRSSRADGQLSRSKRGRSSRWRRVCSWSRHWAGAPSDNESGRTQ